MQHDDQTADRGAPQLNHSANTGTDRSSDITPIDTSTKTVAEVLGEIVWLMSQDRVQRMHAIGDLERLVMPAIILKQFKVFYAPNETSSAADITSTEQVKTPTYSALRPIGAVIWAMVPQAIANELEKEPARALALSISDWKSGPTRAIVRLIAPFGGDEAMRAYLNDRNTIEVGSDLA